MLPKTGDWSASVDVLGQFFYIILVFAIVILIFLICARFFSKVRFNGRGKNLRIIESCSVAPQSSIQILQAGERLFLVGVTREQISILAEITGQQVNSFDSEHMPMFESYFRKFLTPEKDEKKEDGT